MIYDAIVIGAGHNGLTSAGYLARRGKSVLVLERRDVVGGAALTSEFSPGFKNSEFSYVVSLLDPSVIRDLELAHRPKPLASTTVIGGVASRICPQVQ